MSLREPPKQERPSSIITRILVLVVLLAVAGLAIWTAVTNQRIELVEDVSVESLDLEDTVEVEGLTINVVTEPGGPVPVALLHDFDVSGSLLLADLVSQLGDRFHTMRIDLPGYGLSERIPEEGRQHTVAAMAEVVGAILEERYEVPAVVGGVGLGGRVAAELALTRPDLVQSLVMIDADFGVPDDWVTWMEKLPVIGRAVTHTYETGGRFAEDRWAPLCGEGGWCPTSSQALARDRAASVSGSTDSMRSFLRTPPSSLVPSDLGDIEVPAAYIWSTQGQIPETTVEDVMERLPEAQIVEIDAWKAHLESPAEVAAVIDELSR